jgi:hypothetical protein
MLSNQAMIIQLLQTGKLGKLEIGMQIDDVLDYLGLPEGVETMDDLRSRSPELWEMAHEEEKTILGAMKHGALVTMFKDKKLKVFMILICGDYDPMPQSLGDGWLDDFRQMSHQTFNEFVIEHELDHLRYHRHRMPNAWVSKTLLLEVHLFFGMSPRIKTIQSGSPFA